MEAYIEKLEDTIEQLQKLINYQHMYIPTWRYIKSSSGEKFFTLAVGSITLANLHPYTDKGSVAVKYQYHLLSDVHENDFKYTFIDNTSIEDMIKITEEYVYRNKLPQEAKL